MIECNVIHQALRSGVRAAAVSRIVLHLSTPAPQPMPEDALLTGPLEPTNEPYAIAKIAGIKLCESYNRQYGTDYRSVMPTNLYGPGDNFHPATPMCCPPSSGASMRRHARASDEVVIWGIGRPRREFLHVDDMAEASLFVLDLPSLRSMPAIPSPC